MVNNNAGDLMGGNCNKGELDAVDRLRGPYVDYVSRLTVRCARIIRWRQNRAANRLRRCEQRARPRRRDHDVVPFRQAGQSKLTAVVGLGHLARSGGAKRAPVGPGCWTESSDRDLRKWLAASIDDPAGASVISLSGANPVF